MNRRSFLQWLSVGLLATPKSLLRGIGLDETPETVALQAWNVMRQGDPDWLMDSLEPGALEQMRRVLLSIVDLAHKNGQTNEILKLFQVESVRQVRELDNRAFFAAVWRAIRQHEPGLMEIMQDVNFDPFAHVRANDDRVYVLYRLTARRPDLLTPVWPKAMGLERIASGWAMLPNCRLEGLERANLATLDLAEFLDNLRVEVTDVIGHVMREDHALVVMQSIAESRALRLIQVHVVPVLSTDPNLSLLRRGETREVLRSLEEKYGA
jgi:hypothetical protein